MKTKTRRFYVWAECNHAGQSNKDPENVLEFSNGETDEQIEEECRDLCETLIGNNFDTGWRELEEGEKP